MHWFNFVGMGMLAFGIILNEWVLGVLSEGFNLGVVIGAAVYLGVGIWLSIWGGPVTESD